MSKMDEIGWVDEDRAAEAIDHLLSDMSKHPLVEERHYPGFRKTTVLTEKELNLLRLASRGLTLGQVADAVGLSVETVKTNLKAIRYKLAAKNTAHACCEALRQGLID